ncbi:phosphoglycerate mutase-like protein [Laetiporus sulphureus 93-53]|uniref:Phosphoglycerate mutase-like protein n=1 Tax=Laetiporus sulphureus 93-53 TaxID=1314785 RepID=A0A165DYJ2_9APHY|nr:phosphoglycerate mutase-like protein [Laetiporus sulphureus 93-53]KZT05884.1 phosphoglycerate mutase-like protein [Laetiporus sulphureus 93-53]
MLPILLLLGILPVGLALPAEFASSYAGATSTNTFPPPGATVEANEKYFPGPEEVGFAGPTPTGSEPEAIATAPVAALNFQTYPMVVSSGMYAGSGPPFNPMYHWGNLGPWYSVGGVFGLPDTSPQVPEDCDLEQVHLLLRHGARYPTSGELPSVFAAALHKVADSTGFTASGPLEFLSTWEYTLGEEILTPFGRSEPFNLGVGFRVKYGSLLNGFTDIPVFRTTSEDRMVASLENFAVGFFGVPEYLTSYHEEIIIESSGFNNTLAPYETCTNANNDVGGTIGSYAAGNWSEVYLKDTVTRLQQYLVGFNLTADYVYAMQGLCAYETVSLGYSKFCELFTEEEWRGFEYSIDLDFWYGQGPGSPNSAARGVGWVQELVARLTKTPITTFDTNVNKTLDDNNITFPLNQPIYIDATHDVVIANIITALNFTTMAANGPLPWDRTPVGQTYHVQHIAAYTSNLVGQVLSCPVSSANSTKEKFIRFLLNDGAVPLTGISHCETPNKDGLCLFDNFVEGMKERIAEIDYAYDCFGDYSIPVPDDIIDGRMPR